LGLACASGYIELVTVLLAINANVEDKGHKNETTPLMEACANGHKQIVQLLLRHKANVNAQSACGNTPLHYAVQHNHIDIVEMLIKNFSGKIFNVFEIKAFDSFYLSIC
jgi:ankyrin repeat protein